MSEALRPRVTNLTRLSIHRFAQGALVPRRDWVASEEPLEIRLEWPTPQGLERRSLSITMRTPGHDFELAAGFLHGEGILRARADLDAIAYCLEGQAAQRFNVVSVRLRPGVPFDPQRLVRHFYTTSSCGVCGKASLEALELQGCAPLPEGPVVPAETLTALPAALRGRQPLFEHTGGLHAAGLFDTAGVLEVVREDVGRHNALDKLIGHALLRDELPLSDRVLVLSGRASFELVQKAVAARIPIVAAVGAPSSLAVELARAFNVTLLGFVQTRGFNLYSGAARIAPEEG